MNGLYCSSFLKYIQNKLFVYADFVINQCIMRQDFRLLRFVFYFFKVSQENNI